MAVRSPHLHAAVRGFGNALHGAEQLTAPEANEHLLYFLQERWKGVRPVLYGDQYRQARFDDWVFQGLLDVGHLESAPAGLATTPG